ncbi:MAG TPA: hypothetical protein VFF74_03375 [Methylophilaceae bacterium]|nr:hypothetical protein [Methylophilaceae bacterium]
MQAENHISLEKTRFRGRLILLLLILFFAVPLLLVLLMHHLDWHPQGQSRGQLITPARALQIPAQLQDSRGISIKPALWRDKWTMVYVANDCLQTCAARLHDMRQLHASLAKNIDRVQRVLISASDHTQELEKQYPDLIVINQPKDALAQLQKQFDLAEGPAGQNERLYLVDPLGNLMMRYHASIPAAEIRKDLTRLLSYSWAG